MASILTIVESPTRPDLSELYKSCGHKAQQVTSMRKAIGHIKKSSPDYVVAEFFYGYGNNYSGVHISNLDVLLMTMKMHSPDSRVIVIADKTEIQHVSKLEEIMPLHGILQHPVDRVDMRRLLENQDSLAGDR